MCMPLFWVFGISTAPAGISGARLLPDNEALYGICFRNNSYIYGDLNHVVSAAMSIWAVELRSPEDFGHKSAVSNKKQKQIIYIKNFHTRAHSGVLDSGPAGLALLKVEERFQKHHL